MDLTKKRDQLIKEELCDHCLGRQFARLGYGLENYERGAIARENNLLTEESFTKQNVPRSASLGGRCNLCAGLFDNLDEYVKMIVDALEGYELNSILVGTRSPKEVKEREKNLHKKYGSQHSTLIKSELNRLIGKRVQKRLDVGVDFKRPDINAVLDLDKKEVELQVNSLLIYGQYNKYSREIPQTELFCEKCRGKGCKECNGTGKDYPESVQKIIQEPFVKRVQAEEAKFHGAGREDIDARCFGKREFVLELKKPRKRNIDLEKTKGQVNNFQDKVEIFNLQFTSKEKIKELKKKRADKLYRALVTLTGEVSKEELIKLKRIKGDIKQRTPRRVAHRRSDKIRKRRIYKLIAEKLTSRKIELVIKAEAGAYIKELISGDGGRTKPSIAQILNCEAECKKLDILDIDK